MAETIPGGFYEGPKGKYHDCDGKPVSKDRLAEFLAAKKGESVGPQPVVLEPPPLPKVEESTGDQGPVPPMLDSVAGDGYPLKNSDEWKALSPAEKSAITKARKAVEPK